MNALKIRKRVMRGNAIRRVAGLGISLPLLLAGPAALAALDLGPAADFAVFQMGSATGAAGTWSSSAATINGNVAFRATNPGGNANTRVSGFAEGPNASPPTWTIAGGYTQDPDANLQAIAQQARNFSAAAFAAGVGLPTISITGNGTYVFSALNLAEPGTYIVNATTINMTGSSNFILDGTGLPAGSRVIVNNLGSNFGFTGGGLGSRITLMGLDPSQVLFNYAGTSVNSSGGFGTVPGTLLAPNATVGFGTIVTFQGSLIAANVSLSSSSSVLGIPFIPEPSACIAGVLLLLPLGASAMRKVRNY